MKIMNLYHVYYNVADSNADILELEIFAESLQKATEIAVELDKKNLGINQITTKKKNMVFQKD